MTMIPNPLQRAAFAAASLATPISRGTVYRVQNDAHGAPASISRGTVYRVQNAARSDRPASPSGKSRGTVYRVQNTPANASQ
jgi:hypothetical protein